jgi:hypothetical protein
MSLVGDSGRIFCVKAVENSFPCAPLISPPPHTHTHARQDTGVSHGVDLGQSASQRYSSGWYVGPEICSERQACGCEQTLSVASLVSELWWIQWRSVCSDYDATVFRLQSLLYETAFHTPQKLPELTCIGTVSVLKITYEDVTMGWICSSNVNRWRETPNIVRDPRNCMTSWKTTRRWEGNIKMDLK